MLIADAINYAQQQFIKSDSARLDADVLLCSVLKCERIYLYTYPEKKLSNKEVETLLQLTDVFDNVSHYENH